jgi:arsenate reductase
MVRKHHVLFLCTGNCCRSQMAEAILAHLDADRFVAHSAGSDPAGFVHWLAEDALERLGIPLHKNAWSKSWDEFEHQPMDLVITVCDAAAGVCPAWLKSGRVVHWPLPDPSFVEGTDEDRLEAALGHDHHASGLEQSGGGGEEAELSTRLKAPRASPHQPLYVSDALKQTGRVMVKDEDLCVHCGLCAERCPTAAWDMQKSTIHLPHAIDHTWPSPQKRKSA